MNKLFFFILFLLTLISLPEKSFAQDTAKTVVQENFKREIIINNKRFRVYNNWTEIGFGAAYHSANPRTQIILSYGFQFHIHQHYFGLGGMIGGDIQDKFSVRNNFQFRAVWIPLRKDNEIYHLALMGGISYSTGYKYLYGGLYDNIHPYHVYGGYAEAQLIKKIHYDEGIGGAFFINVNAANTIVGIRLDFYLSGAYRGYVPGKQPLPKGGY